MRILLAVLLSTSFAQAMNDRNGEVEVQQPVIDSVTLTNRMHHRIQQIKKQVSQASMALDVTDMGQMVATTVDSVQTVEKQISLECLQTLQKIANQKYLILRQANQQANKENEGRTN